MTHEHTKNFRIDKKYQLIWVQKGQYLVASYILACIEQIYAWKYKTFLKMHKNYASALSTGKFCDHVFFHKLSICHGRRLQLSQSNIEIRLEMGARKSKQADVWTHRKCLNIFELKKSGEHTRIWRALKNLEQECFPSEAVWICQFFQTRQTNQFSWQFSLFSSIILALCVVKKRAIFSLDCSLSFV